MVADLIALDNKARVWIYPADGVFTDDQRTEMQGYLYKFLGDWTAHNQALKSYGNLFHNQFLTLFVDETMAHASGCSIDSSVHFVQELGKHFNADFFNRMLFSYMDAEENVHTLNAAEFKAAYANGTINDKTLVFDHLVKTKEEFLNEWLKPLQDSWHKRFV
jgi:hypothetical protein